MVTDIRDADAGDALDALMAQLRKDLFVLKVSPHHNIKATDVAELVQQALTSRSVDTTSSLDSILEEAKNDPTKTDLPAPLALATFDYFHSLTAPDERQRTGMEEWEAWYESWHDIPAEDWNMRELAGILNKIFHLDALRHPIKFEWDDELRDREGRYGDCIHGPDDKIRIRMDPGDFHIEKNAPSHHEALFSTFARELLHGYFQSLCCDGAKKHSQAGNCLRRGRRVRRDNEGNGHFFGWFLVSCHISLRAGELLGFEWNLFSFRSIIKDCKAGGKVSAEEWMFFFNSFKQEEVETLFGYLIEEGDLSEREHLLELLRQDPRVMQVWGNAYL